ncbi:MAG: GNAT family N-acetyltransferase [Planctomycetota bacterium]|nr:MAG: GNAT family N-acetyltransferase [Planctomycetota bacterium]
MKTKTPLKVRAIQKEDLPHIIAIDGQYGEVKEEYWQNRLNDYLEDQKNRIFGFCAEKEGIFLGYIWGEIRAWEFGSPPCGWIYSVAVHKDFHQQGIGFLLCQKIAKAFYQQGITSVRTMVKRDSLEMLRFFRSCGFQAGPFIELELNLSSAQDSHDNEQTELE